ncbi:MAG: LamG domain-containing protein [Planctomycetota bacterium]
MSMKSLLSISLAMALGLALTGNADAELVGWWRLDEGSGTTAFDSSGNGNDAQFEGAPVWVQSGKLGGAIRFNGSSDYLAAPDSESLDINGDQVSMAAWVNGEDWPGANHVVRKIADTGTGSIYMIRVQPDTVRVYLNTSAGESLLQGTKVLATNEWVHIAVTYDGAQAIIYVDGQLDVAMDVSGQLNESDNELRIGRGEPAGYFMGMIDDVRLYNHGLTEDELLSAMEGSGAAYPFARSPDPSDGAFHPETWVILRWNAGDFAVSHDVYLGDNFDDVNNSTGDTFRGNQTSTMFTAGFPGFTYPDGLAPGTTYYWRIDEVNDAEPNSPWKGDVWSFSIPPKTAYNPDPADGAEFIDPGIEFSWTPGFGAKLHTVYIGTDYDGVNNAAGGLPQGTAKYTPAAPLELETVYYWRVDEFDALATYKGDVWSFTTPGAAGNPQPANGAADVQINAKLNWTPGTTAISHDVYFGTDKNAVRNATTASPEYKGNRAVGSESYDPGKLVWQSDYYWRVDAVYNAGPVKGLVWSFTTADFILVDDFESYNDIDPPDPNSNRIFDKWIDGFGTTDNGALVGNDLPPYAEQTVVHGGSQAMVYRYNNNLKTSEATLTLVSPRDWTEEGVTKLSLWFRGASANSAERMFVALNGTAVVYHDDPAATQKGGWNQWVIDLQPVADQGVNLVNVNTITIGFGTKGSPAAGGTGQMYFDDIRLIR